MKFIETRGWVDFIKTFDTLVHVVRDCRQSCDYCWRTEAVSDHGKVCQVSLDARLQDGLRSGVTERRTILVQQIHKFFANVSCLVEELFSPVNL